MPSIWDDASIDWSSFDAVILRNTWDYSARREEFLAWCARVDAVTSLLNPLPVLTWDSDKAYLRDLAGAGLPVVPTMFLAPGADVTAWSPPTGCTDFVVKPSISSGSQNTMRYGVDGPVDVPRAHIAELLAQGRTVMVQPYLDSVDTAGETAVIFYGGALSHAIRKGQMLVRDVAADRVEGLFVQETIEPRTPTQAQVALAHAVLAQVPGGPEQLLYARVDLIDDAAGEPMVLELELVEPSIFLTHSAGAPQRWARAIAERVGASPAR